MELKRVGLLLKDGKVKDIATADTVAVFADPSVAAVATAEPFLSQAVKNLLTASLTFLASSKTYRVSSSTSSPRAKTTSSKSCEVEVPGRNLQGRRLLRERAGKVHQACGTYQLS